VFDLQPGSLIIIAGRPSMGKTSLLLQLLLHSAAHYGPVFFASLEMPSKQIADRLISMDGKVPLTSLTGEMREDEWTRLTHGVSRLYDLPFYIDDSGGQRAAAIRAKAQQVRRQNGGKLSMIAIDYLQLMGADGDTRNEQIASITSSLKATAKQLECPVVLLSQLNRDVEKRPNKRPMMSDLRDSGAIEQDADLILFPYRDEYYNPDSPDKGTAELIIAKQRNGPPGTVQVGWRGECASFVELDYSEWMSQRAAVESQRPAPRERGFR
jgi:replicative DNA helicase